jgi:hypothetical protein
MASFKNAGSVGRSAGYAVAATVVLASLMPLLLAKTQGPEATGLIQPGPGGTTSAQHALTGDEVVERVAPAVALIIVGQGNGQLSGVGSGVVVRSDGVLLTGFHLVKDARAVQVRLKNGEIYDRAELIDADRRRDVAALRIPATGLTALPVARLEEARPGSPVYVVSNPGGLSWTASSGILSAIRPADEVPGAGFGFRLIQFTAPVSPGSSGGLLVDDRGRALGIVVGSERGQNLNFAVPIESVAGLAEGTSRTAFGSGMGLQLPRRDRQGLPAVEPPPPPAPVPVALAEKTESSVSPAPPAPVTAAPTPPAVAPPPVRRIYVAGEDTSLGIPVEPLEKKLLEQPEFKSGQFILLTSAAGADLVIELARKKMTWDFTYRMVDPRAGRVLGSGKVIAWDGVRAASGLSKQIAARLRELYPPPADPAVAAEKTKKTKKS